MEQLDFFRQMKVKVNRRKNPRLTEPETNIEKLILETVDDLDVRKRLSASKMTMYEGCGRAYLLKHVMHEWVSEPIRLTFGKSMHSMLENFYHKNYKSAKTFANQWHRLWTMNLAGERLKGKAKERLKTREFQTDSGKIVTLGNHLNLGVHINFDDPEKPSERLNGIVNEICKDYSNAGFAILHMFYKRHKDKNPPLDTEISFGRKSNEIVKVNGVPFIVIYDRVDEKNGKFFITDYKTDRKSPEQNIFLMDRSVQLTLYSYVFRMLTGIKEEAMIYYHLRSGETYKTQRKQEHYDYLFKVIEKVYKGIQTGDFMPFYGFHCNMCDYREPCEKYPIIADPYSGLKPNPDDRLIRAEKFDWDLFKKVETDLPGWMQEIA